MLLTLMKEIELSERMIPRTVCRSGSFNRRTTSRPILSIQLNDCVRYKLQDSSSDSQSNLDQRREERELQAADGALRVSLQNIRSVVKPARFCRRPAPAPALPRRRSTSVTSSTDNSISARSGPTVLSETHWHRPDAGSKFPGQWSTVPV